MKLSSQESVAKLQEQLEALRYENAKLSKINQVLVQRVEMGWGNHSGAYSSFESAALLADKVKERTRQLQRTLERLEDSNKKLELAQQSSEASRQMLQDAIDSIPESFVMFDSERRLMMANSRFWQFWAQADVSLEVGVTTLGELQRSAAELGLIDFVARARSPGCNDQRGSEMVMRLQKGRWIQMSEHPTGRNGLVIIYTDITGVKESEEIRRERALAEQAQLLQSTLENMSQGVALVSGDGRLQAWNRRMAELIVVPRELVKRGARFAQLLEQSELEFQAPVPQASHRPGESIYVEEHRLPGGRVLLVRRHAIPGGGYLDTYSDITDRFRNEEAMRESERRIRLITDAMPAMISYVSRELRYEFINRLFEDWFEKSRQQMLGESLPALLGERDYQLHRPYIESALNGHSVSFEVTQSSGEKHNRNFRKTYIPHVAEDNAVVGFFALEQDITAQRRTAQALQQAYDHMEQRVSARTREISEINLQLRNEITEREEIEASLIKAKQAADSANESKTRFLAAASHDLLQPMNAARLFASALQDQQLSSEARQLVESMSYSLENVESLLGSLVDISKLDAGVVEAVPDHFQINDLLEKLTDEYRPQIESNGLHLSYAASRAWVHSDSQLLARILRNLLSNAVRYTSAGRILLGSRHRRSGLEIQVWDTGAGIAADKLDEIFEEFSRIDPRQRRTDKGLGLGLAIVDRLARVLNHEIAVRSWPDRGSCFSVLVPYGMARIPEANGVQPLDAMSLSLQGARVLIIDNDYDICEGMSALLQSWGCRALTLQSLEQLHHNSELAEFDPQLLIADYHLDGEDTGLDAIALIQSQLAGLPPVILITADYSNELRLLAKNAGYSLLNKPVKPMKLRLLMSRLLSERNGSG